MNPITTSSHLRRLIAVAIFGALASSMSAVCSATDSTDVPQSTVKYQDLDVSSAQGAAVLYTRIRLAADTVCRPLDYGDLASKVRMHSCIRKAIADAVTKVNEPALFAVYNAKNKGSQPIILAASQTR